GRGPRDGGRPRPAGYRPVGTPAWSAVQAEPHARGSGPGAGARARAAHARGAGRSWVLERGGRRAAGVRRGGRAGGGGPKRHGHGVMAAPAGNGLLRISELAARSGVSAGTIKHYLREGLLGS